MKTLKIAFRNLNRQKRRSVLLGIAVGFVFLISAFIQGMANGMLQSMEYNIANQVGGNIWISAAKKDVDTPSEKQVGYAAMGAEQKELFDSIVKELNIDVKTISLRSPISGRLIFAGKTIPTSIWGVEENESLAWNSIAFKEGSREAMKKENALLLSEKLVEELNLALHDIILFETKNDAGQKTVEEFQLEGIARDNNLLASGMTVFANINYINKIYGVQDPSSFGAYFIMLKDQNKQDAVAQAIENKFREKNLLVTDRTLAKKESPSIPLKSLLKQLGKGKWDGYKYFVASMNDESQSLVQLKTLVSVIALGVLVVLLTLTMIGVANTFRMIVFERRGEIGTMRACGAKASFVRHIFRLEGLLLTCFGALAGLATGVCIMFILSCIPISASSVFSMFAHGGHLIWKLSAVPLILWFIVLAILTIIAVAVPARKASKMLPSEALRST